MLCVYISFFQRTANSEHDESFQYAMCVYICVYIYIYIYICTYIYKICRHVY